jgi:hypothetical protein
VQSKQGLGTHLLADEGGEHHAHAEAEEAAEIEALKKTNKGESVAAETLLKLAGGDKGMIHHALEDGIKLRTVLATRVRLFLWKFMFRWLSFPAYRLWQLNRD